VPVHLNGEAARETLVVVDNATIQLEAEATHIPEFVEVDIEGLPAGTQILASDLKLPSGSTLLLDADALIVNITEAPTTEQIEAELEEAEAEVGIEREEAEEEQAPAEAAEGESSDGAEQSGDE
jgi:large subunit ribosomal protein L25